MMLPSRDFESRASAISPPRQYKYHFKRTIRITQQALFVNPNNAFYIDFKLKIVNFHSILKIQIVTQTMRLSIPIEQSNSMIYLQIEYWKDIMRSE